MELCLGSGTLTQHVHSCLPGDNTVEWPSRVPVIHQELTSSHSWPSLSWPPPHSASHEVLPIYCPYLQTKIYQTLSSSTSSSPAHFLQLGQLSPNGLLGSKPASPKNKCVLWRKAYFTRETWHQEFLFHYMSLLSQLICWLIKFVYWAFSRLKPCGSWYMLPWPFSLYDRSIPTSEGT